MGEVESLAESILEHGLRQLPEGRVVLDDDSVVDEDTIRMKYTVIKRGRPTSRRLLKEEPRVEISTGHRRREAVRLIQNWHDSGKVSEEELVEAGLEPGRVPVDLQQLNDEQMLDLLTIENAARENLSPVEQARLIERHLEAGRTQAEAAELFGCSRSWVSHRTGLLELPKRVRGHIHDGELSVSQARALRPLFKADMEDVEFPEGNRFHPENIIDRALEGQPSNELRRDVTQFESWMNQLEGKTQQEIREQEYEQDLESDHQSDESQPTSDDNESAEADIVPDELPPSESTSTSTGEVSSQHADRSSKDHADQTESSQEARTQSIGDGAPPSGDDQDEELIQTVASQLAEQIDQDVLVRHLIVLGMPRPQDIEAQIREQLRLQLGKIGREGLIGRLEEIGYTDIKVPEKNPVGRVNPDEIDQILSAGEEMWEEAAAEQASIASLLVAHRVAGVRQETWRTELVADAVEKRAGRVQRDDVPEDVLEEVQTEVERRLEPVEA